MAVSKYDCPIVSVRQLSGQSDPMIFGEVPGSNPGLTIITSILTALAQKFSFFLFCVSKTEGLQKQFTKSYMYFIICISLVWLIFIRGWGRCRNLGDASFFCHSNLGGAYFFVARTQGAYTIFNINSSHFFHCNTFRTA